MAKASAGKAVVIAVDEFGPLEVRPHAGQASCLKREPIRLRATYRRVHGVRHMFASFDVGTGRMKVSFRRRKTSSRFLTFLKEVRRSYKDAKTLYVILDNFSPHKTQPVRAWAVSNGVEFCWTPTNASWLNPIEKEFTHIKRFALSGSDPRDHREETY